MDYKKLPKITLALRIDELTSDMQELVSGIKESEPIALALSGENTTSFVYTPTIEGSQIEILWSKYGDAERLVNDLPH